jgi:16S rRNA processing protein RimM
LGERTLSVGKILKAHGVRGETLVLVLTEVPERFAAGSVLHLEDGSRDLTVSSSRTHHGRLIVSFEGVTDRDQAEALRGKLLIVRRSELGDLPEGRWWPHQIEGCEVITESGRTLGRVSEVLDLPANDVWVARDAAGKETLIPVIDDVLVTVDVDQKRILIRDVPGLTDEED